MKKLSRKHRWTIGLIILSLFVFATVLFAQAWVQDKQGDYPLNGIWITATKNPGDLTHASLKIYAVGGTGRIIYSTNGTSWTPQTSPNSYDLNAVWGSSATDIFAVGGTGTIIRNTDGTTWSLQRSEGVNLNAVWGSASTDVFVVGDGGTILHSSNHGASWDTQTSGTTNNLNAVWGSSSEDVYAVGDNETVLHYDGGSWSSLNNGTYDLYAIWGSSPTDIFIVGEQGGQSRIFHYNGMIWSNQTFASLSLKGVWGTSPYNVYAVGASGTGGSVIYHFDGGTWSSQNSLIQGETTFPLNAVYGASIRDIYAVGGTGYIMRFDPETSTAPTVTYIYPENSQQSVSMDTSLYVNFDAVMDESTITTTTFTLKNGSTPVSGTVSYSYNQAVFTPSANLAASTTYTATLSGTVTDNLGVPVGTDTTWTFTTAAETPDSGGGGGGGCFITTSQPER